MAVPHCVSTKQFLVVGNSHTTAISLALSQSLDDRFDVINIATYFDPENHKNKTIPDDIVDLFKPEIIFCAFGGSEHNVLGLLEPPNPFDFMDPTDNLYDPSRNLICYSLIRDVLEKRMRRALMNLEKIRELYACPIAHICSPPPFYELDDGHVLPRVFQGNDQLSIAPPRLRLKLHRLHSSIFEAACKNLDVFFLKPPDGAIDDQGFLRREFMSRDPTHANALYGSLVVKQLALYAS